MKPTDDPCQHRQQRRLASTIYSRSRQRPLSIITAPVASGKSELLREIASLAAAEGVAASCVAVKDDDADVSLKHLTDGIVHRRGGRSLVLVDDFDRLPPDDARRIMASAVETTNTALIVACDRRLIVPMGSLRLQRKIVEYDLSDLALSSEEVRQITGISMSDALSRDFQLLMQATEGWVGAWRLIADRLAGGESLRRVARDFSGHFALFSDYFEEEILTYLSDDVARFVADHGFISPLSVELAEMLAGAEGRRLWEESRRQCAFLNHSAGSVRELSAHPMFRHFLAERARRLSPDRYACTLRDAATWFEKRRDWPEAIECLIAAGDDALVARTLQDNASEIFLRFGDVTLLLGRGFVPERVVREIAPAIRPETALIQRRLGSDIDIDRLTAAGASVTDEFKAILTYFSWGRYDALRPLAEGWLQKDTQDPLRRALVALMLAVACHADLDPRAMRQALETGGAEIAREDSPFVETWLALEWAIYHIEGGRPATARHAVEVALERPAARGLLRSTLEMVLANIEYGMGRLERATELINNSLAPGTRHATPDTMVLGWATAARCALRNNGLNEALALLDEAYAVVARRGGERARLSLRLVACQLSLQTDPVGQMAFVRTEIEQIQANAAATLSERSLHEQLRMVVARFMYEQGDFREATSLIQPILRRTEGTERVMRWAEAAVLRVAIATAEGRPATACRFFWDCEAATTDVGIRQLFLEEARLLGPTVGHLLRQVESSGFDARHRTLVRQLATASGALSIDSDAVGEEVEPLAVKLTRIERQIVQLVSKGLSNKEIAERLSSSVATVKWHLGNIYGKLGVRSRTAALNRLQTLNLLRQ